ncbi:MAG: Holliday junction resolvase RuvX [Acidobacteriota bacterium]|nr:Holliday junction resolvase RuvX [Acidobacteriota bacterium]
MLYTRLMSLDRDPNAVEANAASAVVVGRIAAFDVGDKRIGVALSDPLGNAHPLLTIYRKTPRADIKSVGRILRKHEVAEAVVGNPLNMSGEVGPRALKAQAFAEQLRAEFGIAVHLMDERLTTWEAHRILDESGQVRRTPADRRDRKHIIDQVAAVLILQAFLECRANEAARATVATADQ